MVRPQSSRSPIPSQVISRMPLTLSGLEPALNLSELKPVAKSMQQAFNKRMDYPNGDVQGSNGVEPSINGGGQMHHHREVAAPIEDTLDDRGVTCFQKLLNMFGGKRHMLRSELQRTRAANNNSEASVSAQVAYDAINNDEDVRKP